MNKNDDYALSKCFDIVFKPRKPLVEKIHSVVKEEIKGWPGQGSYYDLENLKSFEYRFYGLVPHLRIVIKNSIVDKYGDEWVPIYKRNKVYISGNSKNSAPPYVVSNCLYEWRVGDKSLPINSVIEMNKLNIDSKNGQWDLELEYQVHDSELFFHFNPSYATLFEENMKYLNLKV